MESDFYYSKSTKLFVSRKPLNIDSRVKIAANKSRINLSWNEEGQINNIDFDESRLLLKTLGSKMLTPIEYWLVLKDAMQENDYDMIKELMSDKYTEWLNRVHITNEKFIDNPFIEKQYSYSGTIIESKAPIARPGWFDPKNNINFETGEPINVELNRDKFSTSWKYWYPNLESVSIGVSAPIRGYVTSVGKPSFDLGIPVNSKQPKQMVREARTQPLTQVIEKQIIEEMKNILNCDNKDLIVEFVEKYGSLFKESFESIIYIYREKLIDKLGTLAIKTDISSCTKKLINSKEKKLSYDLFFEFIKSRKKALTAALEKNSDVVFVMGHKNPDTDTVISSLFESWRNHLSFGDKITYIPLVQSEKLPDEIAKLLGNLSEHIIFFSDKLYEKAKNTGLSRWISVDQNREPEVQKYFISIIDHHVVCDVAKKRDIPKTLEMIGSCAALITRKFLGSGYEFDSDLAKILYGATLMDTENRVKHKMTSKDEEIMNYLKNISGIVNDSEFYGELMSELLNTYDSSVLFNRDYKEDWGFGFAVAKIKNGFSKKGEVLKSELFSDMVLLAKKNNEDKNFPLTLLKITDYEENNESVNRERVYLVFNKTSSDEFKKSIFYAIENIIKFEFPKDNIAINSDCVDFWGSNMQLSRKKTAPVLEPIVAAYHTHFFSPSTNLWVSRGFLKKTKTVDSCIVNLNTNDSNIVNHITFSEAKELVSKLGFAMLSLKEYWKVLEDAKKINDIQMMESLQGSNFVEFLDTVILDKKIMINHPVIEEDKFVGEEILVSVPKGNPGLIHPKDIDEDTGLPLVVQSPNQYGKPELWRYWEPDSDIVVPCRSFIFLLDQPCWDGKFHVNDSFPNLGIRTVTRHVEIPKIKIDWDLDYLNVDILLDGETKKYVWPKDFSFYERMT